MSKRRGTQHHRRRTGRLRARHEPTVATMMALTEERTPEALEAAKKLSHDQLITMLGPRRQGGVRWYIYDSDSTDAAMALDLLEHQPSLHTERLDDVDPPAGVEIAPRQANNRGEDYAETRAFMAAHPEGYLVVAVAEASIR